MARDCTDKDRGAGDGHATTAAVVNAGRPSPRQQSAKYTDDTIAGRVSPKKGKMMCFDGKHHHASMHPMVALKHIAITFNFV